MIFWMRYTYFLLILCSTVSLHALTEAVMTDPTQPPNTFAVGNLKIKRSNDDSNTSRRDLILSTIIYSKDRKIAIINNQSLQIGDKINAMLLLDIEKDKVLLESKKGVVILTVTENNIKKPAIAAAKGAQQ